MGVQTHDGAARMNCEMAERLQLPIEGSAGWDRRHAEWWQSIRDRIDDGWSWDAESLTLTNQSDKDLFIMFDPATLQGVRSAKLAKKLGFNIERRSQGDEQ